MMSTVEFTPPEGFKPPEGSSDEFDLVCTFKPMPSGTVRMTKFGDVPMGGGDEPQHPPTYAEYARRKGLTSAEPPAPMEMEGMM